MPASSKVPETLLYETLIQRYPVESAYLLAALEDVQAAMGWVPEPLARRLAEGFGASSAQLDSMIAMESVFRRTPPAARTVGVCAGAVCSSHGGETLLADLRCRAKGTDVQIEKVHCQGGCDHAPVAVCGGERISSATAEAVWLAVKSLN